ncbi:hypothetical protein BDV25DRAFT_135127 [Aspergillus avenaceus]|uniref:Uncharacterized protein n=1 Tax=Aspergillus avenaceus TaxID=36643 RepID=A0A5N6U8Y2_ASPAV|nr:hypothetical protein BDV25DRAFT_135127 [Aspergillus avenaceus]
MTWRRVSNSPGNGLYPNSPPMRQPALAFLYRLECEISPEEIDIGAPYGAGFRRSIANITGGTFKGPELSGTVLPSGADWATRIEGTHSMALDARYTIKTEDGFYLYVGARGLYRPGPETAYAKQVAIDPSLRPPPTVTQDDVESFSHFSIESGPGKDNWLNGLVCVGVMSREDDRILIDAYYLTNFEGHRPSNVAASRFATQ